jgi:chromosome segregation ATPase
MSDTVFQSMMRSAPKLPEADINDDSCNDLVVVYSGGTGTTGPPEPDPFRANATTYYTPQTMIPTTPPQGAPRHARKTSKEESIIFSLQTQLALQTELCQQYEVDLRARDETVGILEKKLAEIEKDEVKRRSALRTWKKKVQELEKTCRYLEEEVEGSRHESMERSVMDEASGEALRMLHRQIAVLEQEKKEWSKKEEVLREEVETLEGLVKDRSEDVMNLKESLWSRDESERELKKSIKEAKEQIEQMGNVSGLIDEEEVKKLMAEKQQKSDEEKDRHRLAESEWEQERADFFAKVQQLDAEKAVLEHLLGDIKQQLKTRDDEHAVLKTELEAQWTHTEQATGKIESLEKRIIEVEEERGAIKRDLEELEQKTANMEVEWTDSENKKADLEGEVQEVWNYKEVLEKERDQVSHPWIP